MVVSAAPEVVPPPAELRLTKKLFIKTYGCQMNVYDSARMADVLAPLGYAPAGAPDDADLVILNTCHIREKAAEKVYSELGRLRRAQGAARRAAMMIAVAGCVAQAEGEEIVRRAPVRRHRGRAADLSPPARAGGARRARRRRGARHRFPGRSRSSTTCRRARRAPGLSAFLTVQEGCDKFCTFCVVPYTRGAEFSRPVAAVLARGAPAGRRGRARDHAARPERQRLSRRRRRRRRRWGLAALIARAGRDRRARAHPLHHLASARHGRRR